MKILVVWVGFALTFSCNAADFYKCVDEQGKKTFSQRPCAVNAEVVSVDGPALSGSVKTNMTAVNKVRDSNRVREIDRIVKERYQVIDNLRSKMEKEMAVLKNRQGYARNNLAGATWQQSLATEMQSVSDKYSVLIDLELNKIDRLEAERLGL